MRHLAFAFALAAGLASSAAAQDLDALKQAGTLKVVCMADDQPELVSTAAEPGPNPGFHRELVEGFAKLHGLKVVMVPVRGSEERIETLNRGAGDVVVGIVETDARRRAAAFTAEVLPTRHLAVSLKGKPIATLDALRAAKVALLEGSSWATVAIEAGVQPALSLPTSEAVVAAIKGGKADATVMSISDFTLVAKRNPELEGGVFVGAPGTSSWAVRKGSPALKAALDDYLANVRKSATWSRLVVKYFGEKALDVLGRAKQ
ncbi:MAG: transporter substrate-binding domain-containing protein [Vicinamibacteria bacterium]|jgi:ABC-type amino acid transport substrate-binding protein|nr:transporter substrate-binding domain-containing protein [Vicinamibacteria bacterium]